MVVVDPEVFAKGWIEMPGGLHQGGPLSPILVTLRRPPVR